MCIAIISTAHPSYPLILIDNRDEFLRRPTASASWWPEPYSHVLAPRDLARPERGTWIGVTKQGLIAVLTNCREKTACQALGACSRGSIINSFLANFQANEKDISQIIRDLITSNTAKNAGGFSLVCGKVQEPLAIVSNQISHGDDMTWIAKQRGETVAVSNTGVRDRSWPKIIHGERLMEEAIDEHVKAGEGENALIDRLLSVLCADTLPRLREDAGLEMYATWLRNSIFIPPIGPRGKEADTVTGETDSGRGLLENDGQTEQTVYLSGSFGTQKQTVILLDTTGRIRYFERTLFDHNAKEIPLGQGDKSFEFTIA